MPGFIYFRSGDTRTVDLTAVKALGLDYALRNVESRLANQNSPSGLPGAAFADPELIAPHVTGIEPDAQTWRKLPAVAGRPELWVGYWNDAKPTPEDLARPQLLDGYLVKLADEQQWQVPLVRRFDPAGPCYQSALPCYWDLDDAGKPIRGPVLAAYAHLWAVTAPYASREFARTEAVEEDEPVAPRDDADVLHTVAELLKANYTVDLAELILLQVLADDGVTALVPLVAVDFFELAKWQSAQKKTPSLSGPSGLTSSAGELAGPALAMDPPGPK